CTAKPPTTETETDVLPPSYRRNERSADHDAPLDVTARPSRRSQPRLSHEPDRVRPRRGYRPRGRRTRRPAPLRAAVRPVPGVHRGARSARPGDTATAPSADRTVDLRRVVARRGWETSRLRHRSPQRTRSTASTVDLPRRLT